jgi:heme/copper-type cytochrome/quinol oxidase subunit 2
MQRPSTLIAILAVLAFVSTAGWIVTASRSAQAERPAAVAQAAAAHNVVPHTHGPPGGPLVAPRDGVLAVRVPELPPRAINFEWKPGNLLLAAGQAVTLKIANDDTMQHNFTFKPVKVAKNLPVGATTTISFSAPKPGTYRFYCKYHLQMMEGAITVR